MDENKELSSQELEETTEEITEVTSEHFAPEGETLAGDPVEENSENDLLTDELQETTSEINYDDTVLMETLQIQYELLEEQQTTLQYTNFLLTWIMVILLFTLFNQFITRIWSSIRSIGGGKK